MKKSAAFLLFLFPLMVACSTTPAPRPPTYIQPSAALLQQCSPPRVRKSEYVRDLVENSNARQTAWETCDAKHKALLKWHEELRTKEGTTDAGGKSARPSSR